MTKEHIIYTLGINVPTLTESLNKNKNSLQLILEEQMLYKSFIGSIKTYAKDKWDKTISTITDWKDVAVAVGKSITSNKISELTNFAYRYGIKNHLETLKSILDKIKLSKLYEDYVRPFIKKIGSIEGWKGFLLTLGIGSIITYITTQLSKLSAETMTQWIYKYFSGQAIVDITSKFINFTSFVGWLQPIIKGTKIIFDILKPSISRLNTTYGVSPKPSITELISSKSLNIYNKNKTMKNEQLKKLIKEEIKNLLELEAAPPPEINSGSKLAKSLRTTSMNLTTDTGGIAPSEAENLDLLIKKLLDKSKTGNLNALTVKRINDIVDTIQ